MPDLISSMEFLTRSPLYDVEKPYYAMPSLEADVDMNFPTTNLEFESHSDILFRDVRGKEDQFSVEKTGFEIIRHEAKNLILETVEQLDAYKAEVEELLKDRLGGVHAIRKTTYIPSKIINLKDDLQIEGPSTGAHIDCTVNSGPNIVNYRLSADDKEKYLKPGYRFRLINTWRSLVPALEDRPLAFCDFRTVDSQDLVESDRVTPTVAGEVYYVHYNPKQEWYWLEHMNPDEPLLMIMYDSNGGEAAHFCPHVSIPNPRASPNAAPRYSVETRAVLISKE